MRFAIFTHVEHLEAEGRYFAYGPYVREINLWVKQVEEVEIVGTRRRGDFKTGGLGEQGMMCEYSKLDFTEVPSFNFLNFASAVKAVFKIPFIFFKIFGAMKRADHLHLRCPGNVGLLACMAQMFYPSKPKSAKYAGNWDPHAKQPWSYRFQKWILRNNFLTRNMQVLVYGKWPGQSKNVIPFFTASFSEAEKDEVRIKVLSEPFIFLFIGNLVEGKQPLEAIKQVENINAVRTPGTDQDNRAKSFRTSLEIYGDGAEREKLETYVREKQLEEFVTFKGSRPLEELKIAYQKAHFVILPSRSEGWPKAIAEAMFFGCIPIATPVSCVPWMLDYGKRGVLLSDQANGQKVKANGSNECSVGSDQWSEDVKKINKLMEDPKKMRWMSEEAKKWSQQYTLEKFEVALQEVLLKSNEKSSSPFGRGGEVG